MRILLCKIPRRNVGLVHLDLCCYGWLVVKPENTKADGTEHPEAFDPVGLFVNWLLGHDWPGPPYGICWKICLTLA